MYAFSIHAAHAKQVQIIVQAARMMVKVFELIFSDMPDLASVSGPVFVNVNRLSSKSMFAAFVLKLSRELADMSCM